MPDIALHIHELCSSQDNGQLLNHLSLTLYKGEALGIWGLHHSGKTALFQCLTGELPIASGSLYWNGEPYIPHGDTVRPNILRLSTQLPLINRLTILENCLILKSHSCFHLRPRRRLMAMELRELFQRFDLDLDPNAFPDSLTNMQQLILKIIKARLLGASILLIDDVSFTFSYPEYACLMATVQKVQKSGGSFLFASHTTSFVSGCERIAFMADGRIFKTVENVSDSNWLINRFVNSLKKNQPTGKLVMAASDRPPFEFEGIDLGGSKTVTLRLSRGSVTAICCPDESVDTRLEQYFAALGRKLGRDLILTNFQTSDQLISHLSALQNICLPLFPKLARCGVLPHNVRRVISDEFVQWSHDSRLIGLSSLKDADRTDRIRLILFRLRLLSPSIIVCRDPAMFVDHMAYQIITVELAALSRSSGAAVCVLLSNMEKLTDFADQYMVVRDHQLCESNYIDARQLLLN